MSTYDNSLLGTMTATIVMMSAALSKKKESSTEPAYLLVDECMHQFKTRILRYIEPSKCYSSEAELTNAKSEKKLKVDANTLAIKENEDHS